MFLIKKKYKICLPFPEHKALRYITALSWPSVDTEFTMHSRPYLLLCTDISYTYSRQIPEDFMLTIPSIIISLFFFYKPIMDI